MRTLVVAVLSIAALNIASAAIAAPPMKSTIGPVDVVGQFVTDCGDFQVLSDYRFEAMIVDYYDKDGGQTEVEDKAVVFAQHLLQLR